jgi:uncharacterized membrane protein
MGHVERAIEISAPVEVVFDRLVDLDGLPAWATTVVSTKGAPPGMLLAGATFQQTIRIAGHELETQWRVVKLERPHVVAYEATGPDSSWLRMRQTVTPVSVSDGSRVEITIDYELPGGLLAQVMDRLLLERRNDEEAERSLQNLKALVERNWTQSGEP